MFSTITSRYPSKKIRRTRTDVATSNLVSHVESCNPQAEPGQAVISQYASIGNWNEGRFRYLVAMLCARRGRPFSIVEDPEFREIIAMLNDKAAVHSHQTVARDLGDIYSITRTALIARLKRVRGRIHIGVDGWTSPNVFSFLGITIKYLLDSKIQAHILDFIKYVIFLSELQCITNTCKFRMSKGHTGIYLATVLTNVLENFSVHDKVCP
jgi:hypothetical protein